MQSPPGHLIQRHPLGQTCPDAGEGACEGAGEGKATLPDGMPVTCSCITCNMSFASNQELLAHCQKFHPMRIRTDEDYEPSEQTSEMSSSDEWVPSAGSFAAPQTDDIKNALGDLTGSACRCDGNGFCAYSADIGQFRTLRCTCSQYCLDKPIENWEHTAWTVLAVLKLRSRDTSTNMTSCSLIRNPRSNQT